MLSADNKLVKFVLRDNAMELTMDKFCPFHGMMVLADNELLVFLSWDDGMS